MSLTTSRKLGVRLTDAGNFADLMEHNGYSVRSFADAVESRLIRKRSKATVSRSTIGHLRTGERKTCNKEAAEVMAALLGVPVNLLFQSAINTITEPINQRKKS